MDKLTRKLLRENNKNEKLLSKEASAVVLDIVCYIRASNISEYNQEIVRCDIDRMILDGEARGESVKDIIGEDYKTFCDAVISEVPQFTKSQKVLSLISEIALSLTIVLIIWLVMSEIGLLKNGDNWRYLDVTLAHILWGILIIIIGEALFIWATRFSFVSKKVDTIISVLAGIGFLALVYLITCVKNSSVLFTANLAVALVAIIILGIVSLVCDRIANKKSGS